MGKKKPAKTNETAANLPPINIEGVQMDLPISQLCRHPDNREPSESSVDEIAASIAQHGLLEPLTVRQIDESLYEIISGETRSLAARKLGHLVIRCKVIEADDAKALQLVAIANGLREDLNPIQQAKLIERLCDPVSNGGGGMTRADAALAVGLESASAASNAVGLLRLPEIWQQRIASGKSPATFGRTMLPACEVPAVLEASKRHGICLKRLRQKTMNTNLNPTTSATAEAWREALSNCWRNTAALRQADALV